MDLTPDERARYARQIALPEFGDEGQRRLKAARVLIVGAGGLGSPAALYLTAAGIGALGLVDFDAVDDTNLQRQILYSTADVGVSKLASAGARLRAANPHVAIELHEVPFGETNGRRLVDAYDVVIDGSDNFVTRYLVNDACVMAGRPNVYGSVFQFEGQASVFSAPGGPCYRCLHPEPPPMGLIPNCAEGGVLGVLPGFIGTIQATEAIKLITGIGEPLIGRLLLYDARRMRARTITLSRDPGCAVCGDRPSIRELAAYDRACEPVGSDADITVEEFHRWRRDERPHTLLDVREPAEHAIAHLEGARLIPLGQLERHLGDLPADRPIIVYCKSGGRSARAVSILRDKGFDARNLAGGILSWSSRIDPAVPTY